MKIKNKILSGESLIVFAYASWGLLPIYWKLFSHYDSAVVMAHRLIWSVVFCSIVLAYKGELKTATKILFDRKRLGPLLLSSLLIATNWLSYIYALSQGRTIEAALAYFICPLLSVAFGALFLGERISRALLMPLLLIVVGVGIRVLESGNFPYLALIIGGSFSLYALNKKRIKVDPTQGMYAETLLLAGPALAYLLRSDSAAAYQLSEWLLFSTTGAITVMPMILFAAALKTVSMKFVGLAQYVSPTLMFLVALVLNQEPVGNATLLSFIFIWSGIAISSLGEVRASRRRNLEILTEPVPSNA